MIRPLCSFLIVFGLAFLGTSVWMAWEQRDVAAQHVYTPSPAEEPDDIVMHVSEPFDTDTGLPVIQEGPYRPATRAASIGEPTVDMPQRLSSGLVAGTPSVSRAPNQPHGFTIHKHAAKAQTKPTKAKKGHS